MPFWPQGIQTITTHWFHADSINHRRKRASAPVINKTSPPPILWCFRIRIQTAASIYTNLCIFFPLQLRNKHFWEKQLQCRFYMIHFSFLYISHLVFFRMNSGHKAVLSWWWVFSSIYWLLENGECHTFHSIKSCCSGFQWSVWTKQ